MKIRSILIAVLFVGLLILPIVFRGRYWAFEAIPASRSEVVFWHFWGGEDRDVVDDVVDRFNQSQTDYFVRAIAMPGNNLQAKLFLSVAGGAPPDIVNQDDPVLADWGERGVIHAIDEIAPLEEVQAVRGWMLDSAQRLSVYNNRMYGICNGLDIRALYYNRTALDRIGAGPPATLGQLDAIANAIAPFDQVVNPHQFGYLPDSRRLWAWGYVFGGNFYEPESGIVTVGSPEIINALRWMKSYAVRYGSDNISAFRKGDQSLPGKTFPLLPVADEDVIGRYVLIMDGQWRVRNINAFQERRRQQGLAVPEFGVCPLPTPSAGPGISPRQKAGWVNGNFFVVPRGARNTAGAWAFAKFWIGYEDPEQAAKTCAAGGWIPVSQSVTHSKGFQDYLQSNPLFETFVDLAASPNQFPTPQVVGAAMFRRTVEGAAYEAMNNVTKPVEEILADAQQRIQRQLNRFKPASLSE